MSSFFHDFVELEVKIMTKNALCLITEGSEEIETVGIVDLLRRANVFLFVHTFSYFVQSIE